MNCRRVEQMLSTHLEGRLPERQAAAVAAHLHACLSCRRLRSVFVAIGADLRALEAPLLPAGIERQVADRWLAEQAGLTSARPPAASARRLEDRWCHTRGWWPALGVALAILAAVLGLTFTRFEMGQSRRRPVSPLVQTPPPVRPAPREQPRATVQRPVTGGRSLAGVRTPVRFADLMAAFSPKADAHPSSVKHTGSGSEVATSVAGFGDDLLALNGDPLRDDHQWAGMPPDEWEKIEARIRAAVRVRDDFVTIPFLRLASTAARQIAQAAESYKREAAIVDPRLSHEVTCAYKATALSDLCDRLRVDTGIQLTAGPSVADEKVTVFCEKLPLREVMRQLSRPFGYTWLRSKKEGGEYRYELVQDLRSQLLEEELRNRDRDAALIALEEEINRYRPYLDLSPDEAMARANTAPPEEKKLLEKLARTGWGPIQIYFRLSPPELAALRAGQKLKFGADPRPDDPRGAGARPLSADLARGVLQSLSEKRLQKQENGYSFVNRRDAAFDSALSPAAVPEARAYVDLCLEESELGQLTLYGGTGYGIAGMFTGGSAPYAIGMSPTALKPDNAAINAGLEGEASMRRRFSVQPRSSCRNGWRGGVGPEPKVNSADVLEALHQATGLPIIADYYTRLYRAQDVSTHDQPLFALLNHLSDAMRLRWNQEAGVRGGERGVSRQPSAISQGRRAFTDGGSALPAGGTRTADSPSWLQFRSASFYTDRLKEVPNRLLSRWAAGYPAKAGGREHGGLTLDELLEIAQLSDAQLDAADMAEGARDCWGLVEWDVARGRFQRPHLRFLAQLTPAQRQEALSAAGLAFSRMSLAQQQQFLTLRDQPRVQSLEELAGATLRVGYTQPGGFQWDVPEDELALPGRGALGVSPVHEPTRAMALQAARRIDSAVDPAQIVPTELELTVVYTLGNSTTGLREVAVQVTHDNVRMWGHNYPAGRGNPARGG